MAVSQVAAERSPSMPVGPPRGGLLIDFDNLLPPRETVDGTSLRHTILRCVESMLVASPNLEHVDVRLYGGWREGGTLSRRGSEVAAAIQLADPFPIPLLATRLLRGTLELAVALHAAPSLTFEDTHRIRRRPPRLRLDSDFLATHCASADHQQCPARALRSFTRSPTKSCPADPCGVLAEQVFVVAEQKMIDTMIAADLLDLTGHNPGYTHVAIASADTDFLPPLILARRRGSALVQLIAPDGSREDIAEILRNNGIIVTHLGGNHGN